MSEPDLEKLLGGFAADTLTQEERQKLFTAALHDQQLFNALADEQALKELLDKPDVRRKLLASLGQKSASGAGEFFSWLGWFRRPAGLAFAGGLTAAALAVVLGIRVYQDSLKQAAQSIAIEEARPAIPPPHVTDPETKTEQNAEAIVAPAKKDLLLDKMAKRERAASPGPQEQKASDAVAYMDKDRREQDESRRQTDAPVAELGKAEETVSSSSDQKLAASSAPSASTASPMQAPAGAAAGGAITPTVSAKALFYGEVASRQDSGLMAQEKERAMKPLAESTPQAAKPERRAEPFSQLGRMKGSLTTARPLGLRYSFVMRGTDGQDREVDAATTGKIGGQARLIVEANQDAYLQVWKTVASATPQLLFPDKDSGQISVKIPAGQQQQIPLPTGSEPIALTVRLSRVPFGPITRQEAAMFGRMAPNQLHESTGETVGSQEQASYVVNQDLSPTVQLTVTIQLGR